MKKSPQVSSEVGAVTSQSGDAVVSSDDKMSTLQRLSPLRRLLFIVVGCVLLFVIVITVYFIWNRPGTKPAPAQTVTTQSNDDYQSMTETQLNQAFLSETGYDITKIGDDDITAQNFKTFRAAYVAARIYAVKQDYKKSQKAYAVAASETGKTTTYDFYLDYVAVADINGDKTTSKQMTEKAKEAINSDKTLDAAGKQDLIQTINDKQRLKDL